MIFISYLPADNYKNRILYLSSNRKYGRQRPCGFKGDDMEYRNRHYAYNCKCGYSVNVFIDFGKPQEYYKCRVCGNMVQRKDLDQD